MTPCLLVTANVGSIFEDPNGLLKHWVKEFLQTVVRLQPQFIAVHCQEFGGKNYEKSMCFVDQFVKTLLSSTELSQFDKTRVFLDEDYKASDKFTALGNLYFIHKCQNVQIWDFNDRNYVPVDNKEIYSGNIENVSVKDKLKFPQEFYPQFKWSRKGFMRTRWLLNGGLEMDLVNIHLFHDESNLVSVQEFPSAYTRNRRKALEYTLKLIRNEQENDHNQSLPLFIFGDFNFRLDTKEIISRLTANSCPSLESNDEGGKPKRLTFRNAENPDQDHVVIERKHFYYSRPSFFTDQSNLSMLLEQDKEARYFDDLVSELKIDFPPTYPFNEEIDDVSQSSSNYMNTRCPSWCDRILFNHSARRLLEAISTTKPPVYNVIGQHVPMGDHKPVYLFFHLMEQSMTTNGCLYSSSNI